MKNLLALSEEELETFRLMCSALEVTTEEMAFALDIAPDELKEALETHNHPLRNIQKSEIIKRKTKIYNAILDCAERDSPEAQKMAIKTFNNLEYKEL
jgi:hypothetical protein